MLTTTRDQPKVETFPRERLHQSRLARRSAASRSINSPASEQKPVTRNRLRRRIRVVRDRFRIENSQRKGQPGGHHWDVPFRIIRAKPADWEVYRSIRLRSLREEPDAYASGLETEALYGWFDRRPFRIRIEDGTGAPVYNSGKRLLRVFLPQAEMVTVQLASFMDPGDLELMANEELDERTRRDDIRKPC